MKKPSSFPLFVIFLIKGALMGSADIIPGVSGGTIALITGIYERFIRSLQSVNISFLYYVFHGCIDKRSFPKAKQRFFSIDFEFLVPLVLGIIIAFLTLAHVVGFSFDTYPTYTYAFFFGLILSSSIYIYLSHTSLFKNKLFPFFLLLGIIISYMIVGLDSIQMEHSFLLIFIAGIISFCAMILPGLSGAFILLMLGQYTFMLDVLRNLTHLRFEYLPYALCYGFGGIIGILSFSRVLSYLFKHYRVHTLSFVLGLMIGALRKPGEYIINHPSDSLFTFLSLIIGIIIVAIFSYYELLIKQQLTQKKNG